MPTDLFGRTTSFGLGTDGTFNYTWSQRDTGYAAAADSLFHVDGSKLVIPDTDFNDWDSYVITAPTPAKAGSVSFDIFIPDLPTVDDWFAPVLLHLAWSDVNPFGDYQEIMLGIEQWENTDGGGTVLAAFGPYDGGFDNDAAGIHLPNNLVELESNTWYTAKVTYQITGSGDLWTALNGYKIWKTADTEPTEHQLVYETNSDWTNFLNSWGDGDDGKPWLEMYYTGTQETYVDNLTFDSTAPTGLYRKRALNSFVASPQLREASDPFDRTTTYGLTPRWTFIPYAATPGSTVESSFATESSDTIYLDGSQVVVPPAVSGQPRSTYELNIPTTHFVGWVQFDFRTPATWNYNTAMGAYLSFGKATNQFGITVFPLNSTQWYFFTNASGGFVFTPTGSTWYTAKLFFDDTAGIQSALVKPQGAADSSAIVSIPDHAGRVWDTQVYTGYHHKNRMRLSLTEPPPGGQTAHVDNVTWWSQLAFTADAVLIRGNPVFFADAAIRATRSSTFTADANLLQAFNSISARAVVRAILGGTLPADSLVAPRHFAADAWIVDGKLWRHHWFWDHDGTVTDDNVELDQAIGSYAAGTPLNEVLIGLWEWAAGRVR